MPHITPSHLTIIIFVAAFSSLQLGTRPRVSLDISLRIGGGVLGSSLGSTVPSAAWSLLLKCHIAN
jgi:hypothetical protein